MTSDQRQAISILSRCRMYNRRDRERIKVLRLMLECDPDLEINAWDDHKLTEMLHTYRRQHQWCPCLACLNALMGRTPATSPQDSSLFEETEI